MFDLYIRKSPHTILITVVCLASCCAWGSFSKSVRERNYPGRDVCTRTWSRLLMSAWFDDMQMLAKGTGCTRDLRLHFAYVCLVWWHADARERNRLYARSEAALCLCLLSLMTCRCSQKGTGCTRNLRLRFAYVCLVWWHADARERDRLYARSEAALCLCLLSLMTCGCSQKGTGCTHDLRLQSVYVCLI
jgi:hypothetical protein